ncbi:hypothetical protein RO3G_11982 [Rhizopus delemar RA 99-880]|uniref:Uncharacterized protein n=1 Tax=Rhizopus delemar (strain RA 99-880 / ATCC MYA-4621 / FGSC 9543 / NRRL 43880) TaxID=246409 RepID=I1CFP1_RHIO9|nr:hypothetical protein RO3G_11982 [Rhizopus delemar RA 99-880]|eukprot:EIE87271.1 hypothetical protein RO3G_11982 [Rhizopus delemar RA 99-880]
MLSKIAWFARTDAEAATLVATNVDSRDHELIVDITNPNIKPLVTALHEVDPRGLTCAPIQTVDDDWTSKTGLKQFGHGCS